LLFTLMRRKTCDVFHTTADFSQLNFQEGVSPTIRNAGDAELYGFDVDVQGVLSDAFSFVGDLGYIHAEYTDVNPLVQGVTLDSGLPKTPKWKFAIGPQYEAMLGNGGSLVFNVDWTHTTSLWNDTENTLVLKRPNVDLVNASITYRAPSGQWDIVAGGTNLADERYLTNGQAQVAGGVIYGTYNRPAEWYLTFRARSQ
jgi:iron complex outermembrane receptor protein